MIPSRPMVIAKVLHPAGLLADRGELPVAERVSETVKRGTGKTNWQWDLFRRLGQISVPIRSRSGAIGGFPGCNVGFLTEGTPTSRYRSGLTVMRPWTLVLPENHIRA